MGETDGRGSSFTSRAPRRRVYVAGRRAKPATSKAEKKRRSPVGAVVAVMLCCALLLAVAFADEPFAETMADGRTIEADGILGRLRFLGERLISVFSPKEQLAAPVNGVVTSGYDDSVGWIEYSADAGSDVYAAADGTVADAASGEAGGRVEIIHDDGTATVYELLGEPVVERGQKVKRGDAIAASPSGRVRFCLMRDGEAIDPGALAGFDR